MINNYYQCNHNYTDVLSLKRQLVKIKVHLNNILKNVAFDLLQQTKEIQKMLHI